MGFFGNLSESYRNLSNAVESLWYIPQHDENILKGVLVGSAIFVKSSLTAVTGPVKSIAESLYSGATFFFENLATPKTDKVDGQLDSNFEDMSPEFNSMGTLLSAIDSQNRIWLKILQKDK